VSVEARWRKGIGGPIGGAYVATLFGLVVAIIINIAQFASIEDRTRHNYQAWHLYDSLNLFEVAITQDSSSRYRTAPFWLIGRHFPDSSFVLPQDNRSSWFEIDLSLVAFGRASAIHFSDYDSNSVFDSDSFEPYRFALEDYLPDRGSTHREISERVGLYLAEPSSGVFVLSTPDGNPGARKRMEFVDVFLLMDDSRLAEGD